MGNLLSCALEKIMVGSSKVANEDVEAMRLNFAKSLPDTLAAELALAYHQPRVMQYLACWDKTFSDDHPDPFVAFTILVGPKQTYLLWVEEPSKRSEAVVTVIPATSQLLDVCVEELLPSEDSVSTGAG